MECGDAAGGRERRIRHVQLHLPVPGGQTRFDPEKNPVARRGAASGRPPAVSAWREGKLVSTQKKTQGRGAAPSPAETQPSLIDTNGAYQLASQWLAAISVDVPALESKYPHSTMRFGARPLGIRSRTAAVTNVVKSPLFRVTWGNRRGRPAMAAGSSILVSMDILGSTRQCTGLRIQNPDLLKCAPLKVTNAAALLGPPPPPQHFVEEFLGGRAAYDCVAKPDKVTAWLLSSQTDDPDSKTNRTPAVAVNAMTASLFSKTLTDFNSYSWLEEKNCTPDYGVRLRFTKGAETVEFLLCFECDSLQVQYHPKAGECQPETKDLDHNATMQIFKALKGIFGSQLSIEPKRE